MDCEETIVVKNLVQHGQPSDYPPALTQFFHKAAKLEGVKRITAEQLGHEPTIFVRTFVDPITDETHVMLYIYEAELIAAASPAYSFAFELIELPVSRLLPPQPSAESRFFLIWESSER